MIAVDLPEIQPGQWLAVMVEPAEVAGRALWAVTSRIHAGQQAKRVWFADEAVALAHAATIADMHDVPLLDLRQAGDGQ